MSATKPQTIRVVPVDLWRAVKVKAASQGQTISAVVVRLLTAYVKGGKS